MAREYGKNLFTAWTDDDFTSQPIFDKLLYQVLIGQPPTLLNNAGIQPLSLRRWRKAMRDDDIMPTEDAIMAALGRMEARRFVFVDEDTCEVLVRSMIRRDGVAKQPTVLLSALRSAALVESPKLAAVLLDELTNRVELPTIAGDKDYSERLRKSLATTFEAAVTHLRTLSQTYPGPTPGGSSGGSPGGSKGGSQRPAEMGGSPGGSPGGSSGPPVVVEVEVVSHLGSNSGGEGRPHCARHPEGNPGDEPCGGCRRAREWDERNEGAAEDRAKAARRAAIDACGLCDDNGMAESRHGLIRCDHRATLTAVAHA